MREKLVEYKSPLFEYSVDVPTEPNEQGIVPPVRIKGTFAQYDIKNKNNRKYPKALWEKVVKNPSIITRLKEGRVLGELKHPNDPEIAIDKSCIRIDVLELRDNGVVYGEAEVLEDLKKADGTIIVEGTPNGRILGNLYRRAKLTNKIFRPGISSRGAGEVKGEDVDPDTYDYTTHDITLDPSNEAYPEAVLERREVATALRQFINESKNNLHESDVTMARILLETIDPDSKYDELNKKEESTMPPVENITVESEKRILSLIEKVEHTTMEKAKAEGELARLQNSNSLLEARVKELEAEDAKLESNVKKLVAEHKAVKSKLQLAEKKLHEMRIDLVDSKTYTRMERKYDYALDVILEMKDRFAKVEDLRKDDKKNLAIAENIIRGIRDKLLEKRLNKFIEAELAEVGGLEEHKILFTSVKTKQDAINVIGYIKEKYVKKTDPIIEKKGEVKTKTTESTETKKEVIKESTKTPEEIQKDNETKAADTSKSLSTLFANVK